MEQNLYFTFIGRIYMDISIELGQANDIDELAQLYNDLNN